MSTVIWSRESDLGVVQSGASISFNFTAKVEEESTDPLTGETTTTTTDVVDLVYEPVVGYELPDYIDVDSQGSYVRTTGTIKADAAFQRLAYTENGKAIAVDEIEDAPEGATFCQMVPSNVEYIYFRWKVYSLSMSEVSRVFTLTVRTSWDTAKNTIVKYTG